MPNSIVQSQNSILDKSYALKAFLDFKIHTSSQQNAQYNSVETTLPNGTKSFQIEDNGHTYTIFNVPNYGEAEDPQNFAKYLQNMPTTEQSLHEQIIVPTIQFNKDELIDKYQVNAEGEIVDQNGFEIYGLTWVPNLDNNEATREKLKYMTETENGLYAIVQLQDK